MVKPKLIQLSPQLILAHLPYFAWCTEEKAIDLSLASYWYDTRWHIRKTYQITPLYKIFNDALLCLFTTGKRKASVRDTRSAERLGCLLSLLFNMYLDLITNYSHLPPRDKALGLLTGSYYHLITEPLWGQKKKQLFRTAEPKEWQTVMACNLLHQLPIWSPVSLPFFPVCALSGDTCTGHHSNTGIHLAGCRKWLATCKTAN